MSSQERKVGLNLQVGRSQGGGNMEEGERSQ